MRSGSSSIMSRPPSSAPATVCLAISMRPKMRPRKRS
jgi:hypothetical protein